VPLAASMKDNKP